MRCLLYAVKLGKKEIAECTLLYTWWFTGYSNAYYTGVHLKNEITGQTTDYGSLYYTAGTVFLDNDFYYLSFPHGHALYYVNRKPDEYTSFIRSNGIGQAPAGTWFRSDGYQRSSIPDQPFYIKIFKYKAKNPKFEDYLTI